MPPSLTGLRPETGYRPQSPDGVRRFPATVLLGVLLTVVLTLSPASPALGQSVEVGLGDVERLARDHSPEWEQFEFRYQALTAGEEALARPADPALSYELEFMDEAGDGIYEHSLFLEQRLRTPGLRRGLSARTGSRIQGLELERRRDEARWLSELRMGLLEWVVAQEETRRLEQLRALVDRLSTAAARQAEAGEVAGIDLQLLEASRFQLDVLIEEREVERERAAAEWAVRMGLEDQELEPRAQSFDLRAALPEGDELDAWLETAPILQAQVQAVETARLAREVEERRRWPGMDLMAGYRQMTPDWRGFQFGVSVPLPLRDGNALQVEGARADERGQALSLQLAREIHATRARQALESTRRRGDRLEAFPSELADPGSMLDALAARYEDGGEPLAAVLSSITLLAESYQAYFQHLERYFQGVFELEAITGRSLLDS